MTVPAVRPEWADSAHTYKRYERGRHFPVTYALLLAEVFDTEVESLFGSRRRQWQVLVPAPTGVVRRTSPVGGRRGDRISLVWLGSVMVLAVINGGADRRDRARG